jgi:hypothetical protein
MKPADKAIHGMVSEPPGRYESEPADYPVPSFLSYDRIQARRWCKLRDAYRKAEADGMAARA